MAITAQRSEQQAVGSTQQTRGPTSVYFLPLSYCYSPHPVLSTRSARRERAQGLPSAGADGHALRDWKQQIPYAKRNDK